MYNNNKVSWLLYIAGLAIVLGSHVYMLAAGVPQDQMTGHAVINLVAAGLLVMGWSTRKS